MALEQFVIKKQLHIKRGSDGSSLLLTGASKSVGISQGSVGGSNTMEFTTSDVSGNQATRLLLRGDADGADIEFYSGASGSEFLTVMVKSSGDVGFGVSSPSFKVDVDGSINVSAGNAFVYDGTVAFKMDKAGGTDYDSIWIGRSAGSSSGGIQVAVGTFAGNSNTGTYQVSLGYYSGEQNTGSEQTSVGYYSGNSNSGAGQSAFGSHAGELNEGIRQVAVGYNAGKSNTGHYQVAIGSFAGYQNSKDDTICIGPSSGNGNSGSRLISIGYNAGHNNSGTEVVAVGSYAAQSNTGSRCVGLGYNSLYSNSYNDVVAIGYEATDGNDGPNKFIVKNRYVNLTPLIKGDFSTGQVGINMSSPAYTLDVAGTGHFSSDVTIDGNGHIVGNLTVDGDIAANNTLDASTYPNQFIYSDGTSFLGKTSSEVLSMIEAVPLAGGTMTGDLLLSDNVNLQIGTTSASTIDNDAVAVTWSTPLDMLFDFTDNTKKFRMRINGTYAVSISDSLIELNRETKISYTNPILSIVDGGAGSFDTVQFRLRTNGSESLFKQYADGWGPVAKSLFISVNGGSFIVGDHYDYNNVYMEILYTGPIKLPQLTASTILELNSSKEIISVSKGTAYNKNFGTASGTVSEGNHNHDSSYVSKIAPNPPTNLVLTESDNTIVVQFDRSTTTDETEYEVWRSQIDSTSGFDLIGLITADDIDTTMSIVDDMYSSNKATYYRIYTVRNAVKSSALTGSITPSNSVPDVSNLTVTPLFDSYVIKYDKPNSRLLSYVEIKCHAHVDQASLSEASATTVYQGLDEIFTYKIPSVDLDKYHQFWVYTYTITT